MKKLFISFSNSQEMNEAKDILSNKGYTATKHPPHALLEHDIYPEQEAEILEDLDFYHIYVDTFDSYEEFLNAE